MPKSELNPYGVGLLRLSEANICVSHFGRDEIEYIGKCSIIRREVVLGRIGNAWAVSGRTSDVCNKVTAQFQADLRFRAYYVIKGRRVTRLHKTLYPNMTAEQMMDAYESRDRSKLVHEMDADGIFNAAKGRRPSRKHAPKMTFSTRFANAVRMER